LVFVRSSYEHMPINVIFIVAGSWKVFPKIYFVLVFRILWIIKLFMVIC